MDTPTNVELARLGLRRFVLDFSAGRVSSDGGGVLLREADRRLRLSQRLAACFTDHRKPWLIDHTVAELLAQRVLGLALGYEDLSDHDELSTDPLLAALVGKADLQPGRRIAALFRRILWPTHIAHGLDIISFGGSSRQQSSGSRRIQPRSRVSSLLAWSVTDPG